MTKLRAQLKSPRRDPRPGRRLSCEGAPRRGLTHPAPRPGGRCPGKPAASSWGRRGKRQRGSRAHRGEVRVQSRAGSEAQSRRREAKAAPRRPGPAAAGQRKQGGKGGTRRGRPREREARETGPSAAPGPAPGQPRPQTGRRARAGPQGWHTCTPGAAETTWKPAFRATFEILTAAGGSHGLPTLSRNSSTTPESRLRRDSPRPAFPGSPLPILREPHLSVQTGDGGPPPRAQGLGRSDPARAHFCGA